MNRCRASQGLYVLWYWRDSGIVSGSEAGGVSLTGQVAIVTGGGRGIGRAIAQALSRAGARVAVAARTQEQLDETVALVQQDGGEALSFALDVTDQAAVERMVEEMERQFGPVDLLVNNAGIHSYGLIWEESADDWWRVVNVNLHGPYLFAGRPEGDGGAPPGQNHQCR